MLRKFACAIAIVGFSLGLALAEDLKGRITKVTVDGDTSSITFTEKKGEDGKSYDATGTKVYKKDGDNKVAVEDGLKAKMFSKIGEKGMGATISVTSGKVTEIVLAGKKKAAN